jgi:SulP family sulfate permease
LVNIIVLSSICILFEIDVRVVGDMGDLPDAFPIFLLPDVPLNFETLAIIFPYSVAVATVGLLESLLTQQIVDDFTDTETDRNQECIGQGVANTATGFIGGMAGCAMIGQSIINVKSGGRGRLSTFVAGTFLLIFVVIFGDYVALIPMAALVAIMIMVSIGTFSWSSIKNLKEHPKSSSIVMLTTVFFVIYTHNLAIGVAIGVLLSGIFFAWKISQLFSISSFVSEDGRERTYLVEGQLFFASSEEFIKGFDFSEANEKVIIDLKSAHIWDISAIAALDTVVLRLRKEGKVVQLIGLNTASKTIVDNLAAADLVDTSKNMTLK